MNLRKPSEDVTREDRETGRSHGSESTDTTPTPYDAHRYQLDDEDDVAATIVHAVINDVGRDLGQGSARLGDTVDPDALNALFPAGRDGERDARFTFREWGCRISISAERVLTIYEEE